MSEADAPAIAAAVQQKKQITDFARHGAAHIAGLGGAWSSLAPALAQIVEACRKAAGFVIAHVSEHIEKADASPAVPGYEDLLRDTVGHHRLIARFWANAIAHWGAQWAAEINDGRRASAVVRQLAKADQGSLAISRRASKLLKLLREGDARAAIEDAIRWGKTGASPTEFDALVERAGKRDEEACRALTRSCAALAPLLPDPRGRRLSAATGTHVFLLRHLKSFGLARTYTYSVNDLEDFCDPVTLATRTAIGNPDFSPLRACEYMERDDLSPITIVRPKAAAAARSQR